MSYHDKLLVEVRMSGHRAALVEGDVMRTGQIEIGLKSVFGAGFRAEVSATALPDDVDEITVIFKRVKVKP